MIVICEECGKKYKIDPEKIKGTMAKFKCRSCNHIITAIKPEKTPPKHPSPTFIEPDAEMEMQVSSTPAGQAPEQEEKEAVPSPEGKEKTRRRTVTPGRKGMGLRLRMIVLFFIIPMVCLSAAGFLLMQQFDRMINIMLSESADTVARMAEEKVGDAARAVSKQCALFLNSNPDLQKEDFNYNSMFKRVSVQKIGTGGYTALYQIPGADGVWRTWAHVDPQIVGIDMETLKKKLGNDFNGFWKIYTAVRSGKEAKGYYRWKDSDGGIREKFMVCTPIPGTPYVIAGTTSIDEFTKPLSEMEQRIGQQIQDARMFAFAIFGAAMLLIAIVVSAYGHRLTGRIRSLTDAANRISVGELETEMDVKSGDEIGELGDAISRMQESIRLSIERLRRRR